MSTARIALLLLLPAGASACASILGFQEFDGPTDADVSEGSAPPDATMPAPPDGAADGRPKGDRQLQDARDGGRDADAGTPDGTGGADGPDARDRAAPDGDAAEEALSCPAGYHACSDECVSNSSISSCGTSCEPCQLPLHGVSLGCDGAVCVASCGNLTFCPSSGAGPDLCTDPTSDPDNCGGCGKVCRAPPTAGARVCSGMPPTCRIDCSGTGLTACPAANPIDCVDPTSDIRNCGGCGVVCRAPDGGIGRCIDGGCL